MSHHLSYNDILKICQQINDKYIPDEEEFLNVLDDEIERLYEEKSPQELILHVFEKLLRTADIEIKKIEGKVKLASTCFKGCSYCCYFPIIVTKLEAKLMVAYINDLPDERKNFILEHLREYFKINEALIDEVCSLNFQEDAEFKHKYIKEQLSCPFLDTKTNTCINYEVRPIPCRTYLNYANPNVCADSFIPKEPFSYEFLEGFYISALNELILTFIEEGEEDLFGIDYPEDLLTYDYLPRLLMNK